MPRGTVRDDLRAAARLGVQLAYWDISGRRRQARPEVVRAVLAALDSDPQAPPPAVDPVAVAWGGRLRVCVRTAAEQARCWLRLEDGRERAWSGLPLRPRGRAGREFALPEALPFGVHDARVELGGRSHRCAVISAPRRLTAPSGSWGLFAPVHALWSRPGQAVGDFRNLAELAGWTASQGGALVGTLPLLPVFPDDPSPYRPVSRMFWNELFVHLPVDGRAEAVREQRGRDVQGGLVDYLSAFREKRARAQELWERRTPAEDQALQAWQRAHPSAEDYARFRAIHERLQRPWRGWPTGLRDGQAASGALPDGVGAYLYLQWQAHVQLQEAGRRGCGLYLDFPLGVHPDGYDAWRYRRLFVEGVSVGAPPDPFSAHGQDWGFAPLHPLRVREDGYAYLRRCLAHHFRVCSALRVDHVMGLHRLFWIPRGVEASEGVYVRYPADELYAVLLLEAWRHGAWVVGEDLGTVPRGVRVRLDRHGVRRMYVLAFELRPDAPPVPPAANTVASLGTHDTAPFASFWTGEDLDQLQSLGLVGAQQVAEAQKARAAQVGAAARWLDVPRGDLPASLHACLRFLAESPAACVVVSVEDLWLERERHNIPGTTGAEHPNWRRRLRYPLPEVFTSPEVAEGLEVVRRARAAAALGCGGERGCAR